VVPESVMPPYAFLAKKELDYSDIQDKVRTMKAVGVPYTEEAVKSATADLEAQADPFDAGGTALKKRYGDKVAQRDFDGDPDRVTEMDALVAYLQMLGTLVDFKTYKAQAPENLR
jgi:cytochrome c oxidase cbb3-type subunit 2